MNEINITDIERPLIDLSQQKYINRIKKLAVRDYFDFEDVEEIFLEDGILFKYGNKEFLILTDEEADEKVREQIEETLWAFNSSFLEDMTGIDIEVFEVLQKQCEGANDSIKKLIIATCGLEEFTREAIRWDGRGHFLATYDGDEIEIEWGSKIDVYLYRIN